MKELAMIADSEGITLVHENCSGWGGQSAKNSQILLSEVNSPALKVLFDTGNPPAYSQDAWQYYQAVRADIAHVHIKDAKKVDGKDVYTFPGEGDGYVRRILADLLLKSGYNGGISIEPHLAQVIHTGQAASNGRQAFDQYVEYGRRLDEMIEQILR